jgi:phosphoribosyl 1,2-cyclic phosphodiesterase
MLSVRFWGVRGSIPSPGKHTLEYGGNTACLEIRAGKRLVIVDFGSGARELGHHLVKSGVVNSSFETDIFLSHTHIDHIIGFPHFAPIFVKGAKLRIHCPKLPCEKKVESVFESLLSYEFWPVNFRKLPADISFIQCGETLIDLGGGLTVTTKFLNHPVSTLGFRFEYKGKSIVTSFDHEPFWNIFSRFEREGVKTKVSGAKRRGIDKAIDSLDADNFYCEDAIIGGDEAVREENERLFNFYKNADVLVYDCQYTRDEYLNGKLNWGHSMIERAEEVAIVAGVKNLLLFHHDPSRSDAELSAFEDRYKSKAHSANNSGANNSGANNNGNNSDAKIIVAKEGLVINV